MNPEDIHSVRINEEAACECTHHPFEHDMRNRLLTGGNAACEVPGCGCKNLKMASSAGTISLLDKGGEVIDP